MHSQAHTHMIENKHENEIIFVNYIRLLNFLNVY
jgi:hypothetical protein